jgi:ribonucleotide monophosphatase NagD (HAD superfamily)
MNGGLVGGGMIESDKASQLSKYLGVRVHADQVVVSHSPMKGLLNKYENDVILVSSILISHPPKTRPLSHCQ